MPTRTILRRLGPLLVVGVLTLTACGSGVSVDAGAAPVPRQAAEPTFDPGELGTNSSRDANQVDTEVAQLSFQRSAHGHFIP